MAASPNPSEGYVFAATGEDYVILARRAARSLRRVDPTRPIDLFTDAPLEDPIFEQVTLLERQSIRPKIEALRRSRFDRTIYLDADTIPLAPIDDVFEILMHFDLAMAAEDLRNDHRNRLQLPGKPVPAAFPQLNSGLVAIRANDKSQALLTDWEARAHDGSQSFDQVPLRALLFEADLRFHTLPIEYNVMWIAGYLAHRLHRCAPRILHQPRLHQIPMGDPEEPFDVGALLEAEHLDQLREMLAADQTIDRYVDPGTGWETRPIPHRRSLREKVYDALRRRL